MSEPPRQPRFCPNCGAALPEGQVRFCIECGMAVRGGPPDPADEPEPTGGSGVQLPNARVAQEVIGGTVKLPSSGAVPPGLWVLDEPPGPADVVAVYPPLRPVRGGWSGQIGRGWQAAGSEAHGSQTIFHFRTSVPWFPAPGCGGGLRLQIQVAASSRAWEGRERRGFRFGLRRDGPMHVVYVTWQDADGHPLEGRPLPEIQLMAPPRVPRVSDYHEKVDQLDAREAHLWAADSQAPGAYRLVQGLVSGQVVQEHTPVGRGITLAPLRSGREGPLNWLNRLLAGIQPTRYRVRTLNPFRCSLDDWQARQSLIGDEARALGLDLDPALAAEWWLDRNGYDSVIFSAAQARYQFDSVVIVFRRNQLMQIKD